MTTVPAHQIAADLLTAANHIETYGHRKHGFGSPQGPCCVAGAISVAVTGKTWQTSLTRTEFLLRRSAAIDAVQAVIDPYITIWNDDPERTKAEVVAGLRSAAEAVFPNAD